MKKIILILSLLFSITLTSKSQNLSGNWSFSTIKNDQNESLFELVDTDELNLYSNHKFEYTLEAKNNLNAKGTWEVLKDKLCLKYTSPFDTIRYYSYKINENKLTLSENNITYTFDKKTDLKSPKPIESESKIFNLIRGVIGLLSLLFIAFIFSRDRKNIDWTLVMKGLLVQFVFAIGILKVPIIESIFENISKGFVKVISFTQAGTDFLFASYITGKIEAPLINFLVQVLPTIIFFSALTSLFYYLGILQRVVYLFAWLMKKFMRLSGSESLAAVGNVFLGQTEAPLLVRPYLGKMTKSELFCLMSGGMATIAGGVLAAYIGFLGGTDPIEQLLFAKHLLAASVLSAPAAVIAAKIIVPETEEFDKEMKLSKDKIGNNALEAISNGTSDGLKLAVNVGAMLLVFTALIAMGNYISNDLIGNWTGINTWIIANTSYTGLTMQFMVGYSFAPIAWLMGVAWEDAVLVGQLLGEKTILNEFYAYKTLGEMKAANLFSHQKSVIMSTYILCGFANFASIGIQIGGIGALIPNKKGLLSELGLLALVAGTLASLFTAVIVGMML
ncbi:MAG: nucleoside transporter C-terminal domain-containing protein [Flavobacteriales bacterium]|nr:nucleoside transporter C-terminal domain-containing protein [Flavobacteriales bacterium]